MNNIKKEKTMSEEVDSDEDGMSFIQCECGAEGLGIERDLDEIFISFWFNGYWDLGIRSKIRWIWRIATGHPSPACIIIKRSRAQELIDVLEKMKGDENAEENM